MHTLQRRIAPDEAVVFAELDDEAVLLNVETGLYFGLDPVGARIWALLGEGAAEGEIVVALSDEYDVEPERLRADVATFLALLAEKGLVREEPA